MNLIKNIEIKTSRMKEGLITIYCNNDKVVDIINEGLIKATNGTQDSSSEICEIIEIINRLTIAVFIDKIEGHLKSKKKENFIDNLARFLIKYCDLAAKEARKKAR